MSGPETILEELVATIRAGGVPDPRALERVERSIAENRSAFGPEELRRLLERVNQLVDAIEEEKRSIRSELRRLASERKALRGYARLRSHRHSQRINRKV